MSVVTESNLEAGSAHRLELRVQCDDDHVVMQMWGELYTDRIGELTRTLDGLVRAGRTRVLLDLSRLYDLDGDAITELTRWQAALSASGGWLCLAAPRPWVRRLLEHMCLRGTFTVYPTVAQARNELAVGA
ncbi:STAS domain-containing protein [Actinocrinis sp.]|uniref:STAS domain-containing protein n=1 Tax=Actinocrinis sp. TaxID=1920516 RepID=UPI002CCD1D95|nr:STAS domain-containing protein [Actinocrinis sp.]HXR72849.1 STAS domain-containing protein [Actinocrinis sp.]